MNRPMMRAKLTKWLHKVWKDIPTDPKKAAQEAFLEGYEQGHAQCKFENDLWKRNFK